MFPYAIIRIAIKAPYKFVEKCIFMLHLPVFISAIIEDKLAYIISRKKFIDKLRGLLNLEVTDKQCNE